MSNGWHTQTPRLRPGDIVRAEELNDKVDALDAAFEKLPAPHPTAKGFSEAIRVGPPSDPGHASTREFVEQAVETAVESLRDAVTSALAQLNAALANFPAYSPLSIPNALVQRDAEGDFAANGILTQQISALISSLGVATATSLNAINVVATNLIGTLAQIENITAANLTAVGNVELGATQAFTLASTDVVATAGASVNFQIDSLTVRRLLIRDSAVPTPPVIVGQARTEPVKAWILSNIDGTLYVTDKESGLIKASLSPDGFFKTADDVGGFESP